MTDVELNLKQDKRIADLEAQLDAAYAQAKAARMFTDTIQRELVAEKVAREKAERRADELAAHCERLRETMLNIISDRHNPLCDASHGLRCNCIPTQLQDALSETPRTSLAHIKAQVMREAAGLVARVTTPATMRHGGNYTCEQESAFDDALEAASRLLSRKADELESTEKTP